MSLQIAAPLAIIGGAVAFLGPALNGINYLLTGKPRPMYVDKFKHRMLARDEAIVHFDSTVRAQQLAEAAEREAAAARAEEGSE